MQLFDKDGNEVELALVYSYANFDGQFGGGEEEVIVVKKGLTQDQLDEVGYKYLWDKFNKLGLHPDILTPTPTENTWGIYLVNYDNM